MMLPDSLGANGGAPVAERRWIDFTPEEKRARVLKVAGELFSREGVDFPMPELAKAVGVGVGSLYRQIGKKDDVIAALVADRLDGLAARYEAAAGTDDPFGALCGVIKATIDECVGDRVTQSAWSYGRGRADVDAAAGRARDGLQHLVDSAIAAGTMRPDASGNDLRFLFRAAPSAELIAPGGAQRLGALVLAGLEV
ncbi:MAG: TetR/AcrR family transcriptional regulator [Patulibacter minatonensis]